MLMKKIEYPRRVENEEQKLPHLSKPFSRDDHEM